jgi:hypothetical protein
MGSGRSKSIRGLSKAILDDHDSGVKDEGKRIVVGVRMARRTPTWNQFLLVYEFFPEAFFTGRSKAETAAAWKL